MSASLLMVLTPHAPLHGRATSQSRVSRSRRVVPRLVTGALLSGCSRASPPATDSRTEPAAPEGTDRALTSNPPTRGPVSDENEGSCRLASTFADLEWLEAFGPSACVYDGDRLAASLACERRGTREGCGDHWRPGATRLFSVHNVRFALTSPLQWVTDIEAPHPPCHHGDGQPFFGRFVVWGIQPDVIPVLVRGQRFACGWRHGPTVDNGVPASEAVWTNFAKPRDIMCWPDCPDWVWREHETIIVRPDNRGVHLVAY